ncbi:MAG: HEXXH motif domain-containing protein [Actinomycetota bacterium]|nr:HEXXH motif domain-containing protein [Actinomycetota bacterium]
MTLERQAATVPQRSSARMHRMPAGDLAELTRGGGGAATVRRLAVSERSARMIVLYGLLHTLAEGPHDAGPLASPAAAWRLLTEAEAVDRSAADRSLMYPLTGIWAAHLFRRIRKVVEDEAPFWVDLGYLHAVAATAAIRAGLEFTIDIPVRDGAAVLPGLGHAVFTGLDAVPARVESRAGATTVIAGGKRVTVAPGAPGWRPAVVCAAERSGARLVFVLDDFDPYRDLRGYSRPAPLPPGEADRWRSLTTEAWEMLVDQDKAAAESIAAALTVLVPIPAARPLRPLSASCDEAFAAVLASMPDDAEQLAATLVHETQHVRLGAVLHLFRFVEGDPGPRLYAPWRDDPRPLPGLLQGVYAFIGITDFYRSRGHALAAFEVALWRRQLRRVLTTLEGHRALTPLGRRLVANLAEPVARWAAEPIDEWLRGWGETAADDHFGQWRCHHLPVPAERAEALAAAWLAGRVCPRGDEGPDPDPVVDRGVERLDSRAILIRLRLGWPEVFERIRQAPAGVGEHVAGALPADVHLVAGEPEAALRSYERHVAADPGDPRGWLGLGLALTALGEPPEFLMRRPELVRAVARGIARRGVTVPAQSLVRWFEYR